MDFNFTKCPGCGNDDKSLIKLVTVGNEEYCHCGYCNKEYPKVSAERELAKLEAKIKSDLNVAVTDAMLTEKTEKYYNLRNLLWKKAGAAYIDSKAIVDVCREIRSIYPNDFLAEFLELANSGTQAEVAEYINNIDVAENMVSIDTVLDFLIKSMKDAYITPTASLLERCGRIFTPEKKQEYLTRFEAEAVKIQNGIYEVGMPRDVFLAYSSKDMPEVMKILDFIESNGLSCFAAFRNLQHGRDAVANYEKALYEAIDNCSIFVFVSSINSRSFSCDAFKKEMTYIRDSEKSKFPEYRSYEQIPEDKKKLRIEYRLDNKPTPIADRSMKEFFAGLTYAENYDQLASRIAECMDKLNAPVVDERDREIERLRKAEEARKAEDARQAEAARRAAEARKAAEARRAAEARKAAEARHAEEARRASYSNQNTSQSSSYKSNYTSSDSSSTQKGSLLDSLADTLPFMSAFSSKNRAKDQKELSADQNPWGMFILCACLGIFGVHRFVQKKYKSGLLFLCTGGLLYVGWIFDSIRLLFKALKSRT